MRGEETQFVGRHFLGERVLRLDRRSGRSGDTGVHQKPGAGGQPLGANEFVALIGHLQVANKCRIALATLTAASNGPIPTLLDFGTTSIWLSHSPEYLADLRNGVSSYFIWEASADSEYACAAMFQP